MLSEAFGESNSTHLHLYKAYVCVDVYQCIQENVVIGSMDSYMTFIMFMDWMGIIVEFDSILCTYI